MYKLYLRVHLVLAVLVDQVGGDSPGLIQYIIPWHQLTMIHTVFYSIIFFIFSRHTVRKEMKYSGDSDILHEIVRDTERISLFFSDFRAKAYNKGPVSLLLGFYNIL